MAQVTAADLETYANDSGFGFLKFYKAVSIIDLLKQQPDIMNDEVRLLAFLKNSLKMEGFRDTDCELIMGWLYERKDEL